MYEFTCEYCGKVNYVKRKMLIGRFCNKSCACAYGNKKRVGKTAKIEITPEIDTSRGECVFQPESIECYKRDCINCGWNPVVAKARLEKFMGANKNAD